LKKIKLNEDIILRPITKKEQKIFFGIEDVKFNFVGRGTCIIDKITVSKNRGLYDYKSWFRHEMLESDGAFFASNYVIECKDENIEDIFYDLNIAFNLLSVTSTKCFIYFTDTKNSVSFLHSDMIYGGGRNFGYLKIGTQEFHDLPIIYQKIKTLKKMKN